MKKERPIEIDNRIQPIIAFVSKEYCVDPNFMLSKSRKREAIEPRQICHWIAVKYTRMSLAYIGANIGHVDHASVHHSLKTVNNLIDSDKNYKTKIDILLDKFEEQVVPKMEVYMNFSDYEQKLHDAKTLKKKTDVIKRECERRLAESYYDSLLIFNEIREHLLSDRVIEGFRRDKVTTLIMKGVQKIKVNKTMPL